MKAAPAEASVSRKGSTSLLGRLKTKWREPFSHVLRPLQPRHVPADQPLSSPIDSFSLGLPLTVEGFFLVVHVSSHHSYVAAGMASSLSS